MAAYHRVYDSRHLQADCQEPGLAGQLSTGYLYCLALCCVWSRPLLRVFVCRPAEQRDTIQQIRVHIKDIMMKAKDPNIITTQYVRITANISCTRYMFCSRRGGLQLVT